MLKSVSKLRLLVDETRDAYLRGDVNYTIELDGIAERIEQEVSERFMELPLDADGVPIRVGERVQLIGNDPGTVLYMSLADDGWRVYVKYDGGIGTGSGEPKRIRHYHEPTVEDVLREFASAYDRIGGEDDEHQKYLNLIAEYAAKLTLRGDE